MRVLLTTDTIGGVWTYTKELARGLLQRSHSVALVSFGRLPSAGQSSWCSALSAQYPDHFQYLASATPLEWMDENEFAYSGAEDLLLHLAQAFGADVFHSSQFCFGKLPLRIPKLVVAHSDVLSWAAACRPDGLDSSSWLDRYKQLVQTGLLSSDAVVAPTRWMLKALAGHFSLPGEAYVIPNGRDCPPCSAQLVPKLQAVSVGRLWDDAKGLSLLAEVRSPFPLFVAGEVQHGTASAPPSLGQASLLGPLEEQPLIDLFRCSAVYLALSIYEPFGLAPLEAALCGCAIIANQIPSLREVWGSNALYFKDAPSLSRLLAQLASDPRLLQEFQARALTRALEMSRTRMVEQYLGLYRHLLEPAHQFRPAPMSAEVPSRAS